MECDKCGKPMTLRTAKTGKNAGNQFWGCSGFPACKNIMDVDTPKPDVPQETSNNSLVKTETDKPHSYEFGIVGKAGGNTSKHKIYYNTVSELDAHMKQLELSGLIENGEEIETPQESGDKDRNQGGILLD